jgi:hypothetical protein
MWLMNDAPEAAHLAPGGPATAAAEWMRLIVDYADLNVAWSMTDEPLRLALVQSWMMLTGRDGRSDRDEVAAGLVVGQPADEWSEFAAWRLGRWREITFRDLVQEGWGIVSAPEYVGPDLEFVRFAVGAVDEVTEIEGPIAAQTLTMRLAVDAVWLVAGIGRTVPRPGWPPSEDEIATEFGPG